MAILGDTDLFGVMAKVVECGVCGARHAIPLVLYQHYYERGGFWYCPNGHTWGFPKDGCENARLRQERDRLKQRLAEKDDLIAAERRSAQAYKGQVTKLRKRAKAGVCPCCTRHFTNLERHIKSKHPDFAADVPELKVVEGGKTA